MTEDRPIATERLLSPWARVITGISSLASGVMISLWASSQESALGYALAAFCFLIVGAVILPGRFAQLCGRIIALAVLILISFLLVDGMKDFSLVFLLQSAIWVVVFGIPAAIYLIRGGWNLDPGPGESSAVVEIDDQRIRCVWPEQTQTIQWDDIRSVILVTTDEGPFVEDIYWHIESGDQNPVVIPNDALGADQLLDRMQQKLNGFDDKAFIQAMGSTSNASFLVWSDAGNDRL